MKKILTVLLAALLCLTLFAACGTLCGGSGGGRPDSAQGGTSEIFRVDEAMAQLTSIVSRLVE